MNINTAPEANRDSAEEMEGLVSARGFRRQGADVLLQRQAGEIGGAVDGHDECRAAAHIQGEQGLCSGAWSPTGADAMVRLHS